METAPKEEPCRELLVAIPIPATLTRHQPSGGVSAIAWGLYIPQGRSLVSRRRTCRPIAIAELLLRVDDVASARGPSDLFHHLCKV